MQNMHDASIVIEMEPHAPLTYAESVFGRVYVLKPQHIAFGLAGKRFYRQPDPMLLVAIETCQLLQSPRPRSLASSCQPEAPHGVIVGDSFPLFDLTECFGDGRPFLSSLRFIVKRDISQRHRHVIGTRDQCFEHPSRGRNVFTRKRFDEVVQLLTRFSSGHTLAPFTRTGYPPRTSGLQRTSQHPSQTQKEPKSLRMLRIQALRSLHIKMVPKAGLEPARVSPHAPQTCASTNSATWASEKINAAVTSLRGP